MAFNLSSFGQSAAGAGVSTGSNILGTWLGAVINGSYNWRYQQKQNAWNAEQATLAYNRQREFWNEQFDKTNEYNTPANQIARLRAAGINPNLAYASGQLQNVGSSPSSSVTPASGSLSANYGGVNLSNIGSRALNDFVALQQNSANINLIKNQSDKVRKEYEYQGLENAVKAATLYDEIKGLKGKYGSDAMLDQLQGVALNAAKQEYSFQGATYDDRISLVRAQKESAELDVSLKKVQNQFEQARLPYAKKLALNEYLTAVQNLSNLVQQGALTVAEANKAYSDIKLNSKLGKLYQQNTKESKARENESKSRTSNINQDTKSKELYNTREAIQQSFDFKNPLFTENGEVNYQGIGNFIKGATGVAVDVYKAKHGKVKGLKSKDYKGKVAIQNSPFYGTTTW